MSAGLCDLNTMKNSIETEKTVFCRDAMNALRPAAAAAGSGSPPASTLAALASTTFWLRQITPHTLSIMIVPSSMPVMIADAAGLLAERRWRSSPW